MYIKLGCIEMQVNMMRGRKRARVTPAGFDFEMAASDGTTNGIIFE
jgi:hypothetical protein